VSKELLHLLNFEVYTLGNTRFGLKQRLASEASLALYPVGVCRSGTYCV
jgi:hypothetical protein